MSKTIWVRLNEARGFVSFCCVFITRLENKRKKMKRVTKGTKKESWFVLEPFDCHLQCLWCSFECRQQTKDNWGSYRQCDKIVIIFLWLVAIAPPTCWLSISHNIYCRDQQWSCCWGDQLSKPFQTFRFPLGGLLCCLNKKQKVGFPNHYLRIHLSFCFRSVHYFCLIFD